MIGDLFDSPWKILIVAVVIIVLFGSRKLPDAARSLGRSMRILKREVQDMHSDDEEKTGTTAQTPAQIEAGRQQPTAPAEQPQASATGAATGNGAPAAEANQTTRQPG